MNFKIMKIKIMNQLKASKLENFSSIKNLIQIVFFFLLLVSDSAPHLECLAEFQENLRKTKNFSAFLANVRKAFSTMVYS